MVDYEHARRVSKTDKRETDVPEKRQKQRTDVNVLLLGQAESGKSTLKKLFQLYHGSPTLDRERPSWRPIVYFSVIQAVRTILDELDRGLTTPANLEDGGHIDPSWSTQISHIRHKLLPLVTIEDGLASELGGRSGAFPRAGWQYVVTSTRSWPVADMRDGTNSGQGVMATTASRLLVDLQYDVVKLWQHPAVKTFLRMRRLRLEESAAFFLDNIHRLGEPDYLPTIDDILYVHLRTLGVIEQSFDINFGENNHRTWILYDMGGSRGQRHGWVPYFEDAFAIIFLAPISAFDQCLEEDPRTNRIEDSLRLFTATCSNKFLKDTAMILLLNKVDILKTKLQAGIMVNKHITSYGERENTYEEVAEYFRSHFDRAHKRRSVHNGQLYIHFTAMFDTPVTQRIIGDVNDAIMRSILKSARLL